MEFDAVTAEIRPRSDWEAVDLGCAMVRRDFWRSFTVWWMAMVLPMTVAAFWLWNEPMVFLVIFWWFKPAGARMVLFGLSRRLFGERPSWRAIGWELPRAWWRRFFYRFVWARFSPWLPVTLVVEELEGLRGRAYRQRCVQVMRRGEGVLMWLFLLSELVALWLALVIILLVMMLIPRGQESMWKQVFESWDPNDPLGIPLLISRSCVVCVMIGISLTDVFVTGAGFGLYINNRSWIEGWDVELAFRRLALRLGKVLLVLLFFGLASPALNANSEINASTLIREVKADDVFRVHTVKERIPQRSSVDGVRLPGEWLLILGRIFMVSGVCLLLSFVVWQLWKNRHIFTLRRLPKLADRRSKAPRVVMGMEVFPASLPSDLSTVAWGLWLEGRPQEALGLLYRGAICRSIELGQVAIQESDTEGDCLRRVTEVGASLHPAYFKMLTEVWVKMAYAEVTPKNEEMQALCAQWPFDERRRS